MCDYSLHNVMSRPAKIGEKLRTHSFNAWTCGFAAPEDANTAVCVHPGTELAFATPVKCSPRGLFAWRPKVLNHTTAIFRQVNKDNPRAHHDALEFPDGQIVLLTTCLKGRKQRCSSFQHNRLPQPRQKPKNGLLTWADFATLAAGLTYWHLSQGLFVYRR